MKRFLVLLVMGACATYKGDGSFEKLPDVFYTDAKLERQKAEVYRPTGAGPFPGVILVHGGGWQGRDLSDMRSIAESLASHGFVVMNINYRLAPEHRHPAPVDDLETALKYFKQHAADYRLDVSRLGLWGYSSGGHTVSYYALTRAQDPALKVQAVVSGGAPYDFTWYPLSPYINAYTSFYRDQALDLYQAASPVNQVTPHAPPFLLYHAFEDRLVEWAQASAFEAKLRAANRPVKRVDITWWGHGTAFALSQKAVKHGVKFLQRELAAGSRVDRSASAAVGERATLTD